MTGPSSEESDREEIRRILTENIKSLDERVEANRSSGLSGQEERMQLKRLRTLAHLARQYRLLARDADVDEMEAELDILKAAVNREEGQS